MTASIQLTVLTGPHKNRSFHFQGPTEITVGRAEDCAVRLAGDERDCTVSRYHCAVDINSSVRVKDLGSLNGTYRNGKKLATDPAALPPGAESPVRVPSVVAEVEDGDIVTVGETSFKINFIEPAATAC
jgi:pSer/pThr/pTyr-binding forkhead associated (FHA) protein